VSAKPTTSPAPVPVVDLDVQDAIVVVFEESNAGEPTGEAIMETVESGEPVEGEPIPVGDRDAGDVNRRPRGYWQDKENCRLEAAKYSSRLEFLSAERSAYTSSLRYKWIDEICAHMDTKKMPDRHWHNRDTSAAEALKYTTRNDFRLQSPGAYNAARKFGWINEICKHMRPSHMNVARGHWRSKENCAMEALKYDSRASFQLRARGACTSAIKMGWLEEICAHMHASAADGGDESRVQGRRQEPRIRRQAPKGRRNDATWVLDRELEQYSKGFDGSADASAP
jgi:hypothetical protein